MATRRPTRRDIIEQDARELARLGDAQQLVREMGGCSLPATLAPLRSPSR